MAITLERILAAVNNFSAALVREGINTRALAVLGDKPIIRSVRLNGDVIEFTARAKDRSYQCHQNLDGEVVIYRHAKDGSLVFEGVVTVEAGGVLRKVSALAVEHFDEQGTLFRREYPTGVIEYYDRDGNIIGIEDPIMGTSRAETPVQRTKRAAWNNKLSAKPPRRLVPKELGTLPDTVLSKIDGEPIIARANDKAPAMPLSMAMGEVAMISVDPPPVGLDHNDASSVVITGASAMILMSLPGDVDGTVAIALPGAELASSGFGSSRAIAAVVESDVPGACDVSLRAIASDETAQHDRCSRMSLGEGVISIGAEDLSDDALHARGAAMFFAGDVSRRSEKDERVLVSGGNIRGDIRSDMEFVSRGRRKKAQRHEDASAKTGFSPEGGLQAMVGRQALPPDGSEHATDAPRYPAVPVSAVIMPIHKADMKSTRIVAEASDPEQADYDQPEDDGRRRQQHDDHQDDDDTSLA